MALVKIKPLPVKKWHNKVNNEAFGQARVIEALYDPIKGELATGLTDEEAAEYGKRLNANLTNIINPEEPHPFYSSKVAWVKLPNATVVLDTTKPLDFVKVKMIKANKFVANSLNQYNEGLFPEATHYIIDEEEEVSIKALRGQKLQKASEILRDMSADKKIALIQVISNKNLKGKSNDYIDAEVLDILENNIDDFFTAIEYGSEKILVKAQVKELLQKNILTKQGTAIFYMGDAIGVDEDDAARWFQEPNNVNIRMNILNKLEKR